MTDSLLDAVDYLVNKAKQSGADAADAIGFSQEDLNARVRLGSTEALERAESNGIGLRVLLKEKAGYKQAMVSSSDLSAEALDRLTDEALTIARLAPEDPYAGLADETEIAETLPALALYDETVLTPEALIAAATECEAAALAVEGVTNSDGAEASFGHSQTALVISNGFKGHYETSSYSVSASVIAGEGLGMETDYDYSTSRFFEDLKDIQAIGTEAGERAVRRLGARKVSTQQVPVIFDKRVASSLMRALASAINGASIARKTSFLRDKMSENIFKPGIQVIDNPLMPRGLGSHSFDAEGIVGEKRAIIEDGRLTSWLLDTRSARQLGLQTTGHAGRGLSSAPSPGASNFYLQSGEASPEELIADIKDGFFVTDVFGMGVNGVTGDYSQGAAGIWIENGKLSYPVSELTIASNLLDMYQMLTPANDLEFNRSITSPSVRIDTMTVAGT